MDNVLEYIAGKVQERLKVEKEQKPEALLREEAAASRVPFPVIPMFVEDGFHIIAEIKPASPSLGPINLEIDPVRLACDFLEGGATMLSVLTEPELFHGSLSSLRNIRSACPDARLLMKNFILDEYQLLQARVAGADAILLIVALLGANRLEALHGAATRLGLTPLVEVHNRVGVGNRQSMSRQANWCEQSKSQNSEHLVSYLEKKWRRFYQKMRWLSVRAELKEPKSSSNCEN